MTTPIDAAALLAAVDSQPRPVGCQCDQEPGDSDCAVHPNCPSCGETLLATELASDRDRLRAELQSLNEHHQRVVTQRNKDWDALMVEIAKAIGSDEDREAAELDETDEFDPWNALRSHASDRDRLAAELARAKALGIEACEIADEWEMRLVRELHIKVFTKDWRIAELRAELEGK